MSRQRMGIGDPRVYAVITTGEGGLRGSLYTADADLYFHADNGRGVREMVVENPLPPGNALLIPGTAHFSRSWAVQTEALGRSMVRTPWQSGWPPSWPSTAA